MRIFQSLTALLLAASSACAASSWGFENAKLVVKNRDGILREESLSSKSPLESGLELGAKQSMKITLTTTENGKATRAHQAFVMLREEETGLEAPFALDMKSSGKGSVDIPQKDLPVQFLLSTQPLKASIVIGSFGSSEGLIAPLFDVNVTLDGNTPAPKYQQPLRYGKMPEIHHIFKKADKVPPKIVSLFFVGVVAATVPALFIAWLALGANVSHMSKAMGTAPISHPVFYSSILAMEGVFFMYYVSWNLFQVLPAMGIVGTVLFLSGSKALGEIQSRRFAGER